MANNEAHTPGPWRIEDGSIRCVVADGHLGPICDMRSRLDYSGMHPIVAETMDANARLIAAAPELLRALRDVIGWIPGPVLWHSDAAGKAVDRARAAIAAATNGGAAS